MKKLLTLLLSMCMFLCLGAGLTACGDGGTGDDGVQQCVHSYAEKVTSPTCTERGYTTYTCEYCGDSYKDDYVDASHNYGTYVEEVVANCTTSGTLGHYTCATCEKNFDADKKELSSLVIPASHNYGTWIDEVPNGCFNVGELGHYHCASCNKDFDENKNELQYLIIPASHNYGTWIEEVAADCESEGTLGHYHCSGCDNDFDQNKNQLYDLTIELKDHNYGTWIEEVAADCDTDGVLGHYHCSVCSKNFNEDKYQLESLVIPATHDYEYGYCKDCSQPKYADGLNFTLSTDETYYSVSGLGECQDEYIIIPSTHNDLPVKAIDASVFKFKSGIISVIIPDTVTSIGTEAFRECGKLKEITIGKGVKDIGTDAFYGCNRLQKINFHAENMNDLTASPFSLSGNEKGMEVLFGKGVKRVPNCLFKKGVI